MNKFRQRGQAFIVAVLVILIGASGLVYYLANPATIKLKQDEQTAAAFAQAKQALIGYAASHSSRPGALPCPDNNDDGTGETPSPNCPTYLGRLPWRSLGLPDIRDGNGERLWYAVSTNFRNLNPASGPILNSETAGQLTVNGTAAVVAVLISPGTVLPTQSRGTANANTASNYLEGDNAIGGTNTNYISGNTSSLNDQLMPLTRDQLMAPVELRVAREIRTNLQQYYTSNGYYPPASALTATTCTSGLYQGRLPTTTGCTPATGVTLPDITLPAWFVPNEWYKVLIYGVAPRCTPKINSTTTPGSLILLIFDLGGGLCTFIPFIGAFLCTPMITTYSIDTAALNCNNTTAGPFLTVDTTTNVQSLLLTAGAPFSPSQNRITLPDLADFLENTENIDNNYLFTRPQRSVTNNDNLVIVSP